MKKHYKKLSSLLSVFALTIFLVVGAYGILYHIVHAATQDYTPLAPLPGTLNGETTDLEHYLPGIFKLAIGIAGVLAVIEIIIGGLQYMSTDAIGGKSEGRERITNAIMGLLLALGAYIILNTISPNFVKLNINIQSETVTGTAPPVTPACVNRGVSCAASATAAAPACCAGEGTCQNISGSLVCSLR